MIFNINFGVVIKYWCLFLSVYFGAADDSHSAQDLAIPPVTLRLPAELQVASGAEIREESFLNAHKLFRPTDVFLRLRIGMGQLGRIKV